MYLLSLLTYPYTFSIVLLTVELNYLLDNISPFPFDSFCIIPHVLLILLFLIWVSSIQFLLRFNFPTSYINFIYLFQCLITAIFSALDSHHVVIWIAVCYPTAIHILDCWLISAVYHHLICLNPCHLILWSPHLFVYIFPKTYELLIINPTFIVKSIAFSLLLLLSSARLSFSVVGLNTSSFPFIAFQSPTIILISCSGLPKI